jgi:pilus assembly protein CpaE
VLDQPIETPRLSQTISVISAAGGAGSTTIACHLAVELAGEDGISAAVIDLDFDFGGVARAFDVAPHFTIADIASAGVVDAVLLEKAAVELPCGVHVVARPPSIHAAQGIDDDAVRNTIRAAARQYPYVVLDLPRKLDPICGQAIELSNKLLIVVQLTVPNLDNAKRLIEAVTAEGVPPEIVEIVVNRYRKSTATCTLDMVESQLKKKVYAVVPSDYHAVRDSVDYGKTLAKRNPVRIAIAEMAARIVGQPTETAKKGWLSGVANSR